MYITGTNPVTSGNVLHLSPTLLNLQHKLHFKNKFSACPLFFVQQTSASCTAACRQLTKGCFYVSHGYGQEISGNGIWNL